MVVHRKNTEIGESVTVFRFVEEVAWFRNGGERSHHAFSRDTTPPHGVEWRC